MLTFILILLITFVYGQYDITPGNSAPVRGASISIDNPHATGFSPVLPSSNILYFPPPEIPHPDYRYIGGVLEEELIKPKKEENKASDSLKSPSDTVKVGGAKVKFTIRNLGQNAESTSSSYSSSAKNSGSEHSTSSNSNTQSVSTTSTDTSISVSSSSTNTNPSSSINTENASQTTSSNTAKAIETDYSDETEVGTTSTISTVESKKIETNSLSGSSSSGSSSSNTVNTETKSQITEVTQTQTSSAQTSSQNKQIEVIAAEKTDEYAPAQPAPSVPSAPAAPSVPSAPAAPSTQIEIEKPVVNTPAPSSANIQIQTEVPSTVATIAQTPVPPPTTRTSPPSVPSAATLPAAAPSSPAPPSPSPTTYTENKNTQEQIRVPAAPETFEKGNDYEDETNAETDATPPPYPITPGQGSLQPLPSIPETNSKYSETEIEEISHAQTSNSGSQTNYEKTQTETEEHIPIAPSSSYVPEAPQPNPQPSYVPEIPSTPPPPPPPPQAPKIVAPSNSQYEIRNEVESIDVTTAAPATQPPLPPQPPLPLSPSAPTHDYDEETNTNNGYGKGQPVAPSEIVQEETDETEEVNLAQTRGEGHIGEPTSEFHGQSTEQGINNEYNQNNVGSLPQPAPISPPGYQPISGSVPGPIPQAPPQPAPLQPAPLQPVPLPNGPNAGYNPGFNTGGGQTGYGGTYSIAPAPQLPPQPSYGFPQPTYQLPAPSFAPAPQSGCCGGNWLSQQGGICAPINYNSCHAPPPPPQPACGSSCGGCSSSCAAPACAPACPSPCAAPSSCCSPCPPPQLPNFCGGRKRRSLKFLGLCR